MKNLMLFYKINLIFICILNFIYKWKKINLVKICNQFLEIESVGKNLKLIKKNKNKF